MHRNRCFDPRIFPSGTCKLLSGVCWICGLLVGMYAAAGAGDLLLLTMRGNCLAVSISGLLITLLPFLLTAIAVFLPHPGFLIPVILWKAFTYGFCAYGLAIVYHGAAWLVRILLMFSQTATVPLLMWLWLRKCNSSELFRSGELAACGAAVVVVGILDYCLISPLAVTLI